MSNCECRHNRTSHISVTEMLCGHIVAGFCVLGRIQQQPLFSLISARATSGSLYRPILDSLCSQTTVLAGQGGAVCTGPTEWMQSPPITFVYAFLWLNKKYAAFKIIAVSLKWDLALRCCIFKQNCKLGVFIFFSIVLSHLGFDFLY